MRFSKTVEVDKCVEYGDVEVQTTTRKAKASSPAKRSVHLLDKVGAPGGVCPVLSSAHRFMYRVLIVTLHFFVSLDTSRNRRKADQNTKQGDIYMYFYGGP